MINLLPPELKKQVRAARHNVILMTYCVVISSSILMVGGIFAVGLWADNNDRVLAQNAKDVSTQAAGAFTKTRSAAEAFAKDLTAARAILGSNVSFSKLILDIASVIPKGVILNTLSLGTTSSNPNAPIDISGRAVSAEAAIHLKNSLEESSVFENVSIVNLNRTDYSAVTDPDPILIHYPFDVSLKAQFTKTTAQTTANAAKTGAAKP